MVYDDNTCAFMEPTLVIILKSQSTINLAIVSNFLVINRSIQERLLSGSTASFYETRNASFI